MIHGNFDVMVSVVSPKQRQRVMRLFPIYLNKELFLLPSFPFSLNLTPAIAFLFLLVVLTFDLTVPWLSSIQTEWMVDGCSWRQGKRG